MIVNSTKEAMSDSTLEMFGFFFFFLCVEENGKRSSVTANIMTLHDCLWPFFHVLFINLLYSSPPLPPCVCSAHMVTEYMGIRNESFMKMAAVGTWMGDFVTAWMVSWFSITLYFAQ